MNYTSCLATSAVTHPDLTLRFRLENALTAFLLLDLGELVASERAREMKVSKTRLWLPVQTQKNFQELCGAVAIQTTSVDSSWLSWRSTEIPIETHFGELRRQFSTSQFRVRDFLHAQAKKGLVTKRKQLERTPQAPANVEPPCSETEFVEIAEQALTSALRLMAVCAE